MIGTIEERVALGAAWLDETRPTWLDEVDLDLLDLQSCDRCVLGQMVCYERDRYEGDRHLTYVDSYGYEIETDVAELIGYDDLFGNSEGFIEGVLAKVDGLKELVMEGNLAEERGFHSGEVPTGNRTSDQEWSALTNEWRRVILERRAAR